MVKTAKSKDGRDLLGRLEDESLLELIEPLCRAKSSAYLWIRYGGEEGHFYFHDGRMVHAATKSLRGKESAYHLVSWRHGVFRVQRDIGPEVQTVDIGWKDFQQQYRAELEKIALSLVPQLGGGFYLALHNTRGEPVWSFDRTAGGEGTALAGEWFAGPEFERAGRELRRGNIPDFRQTRPGRDGKSCLALVRYLPELRYFVNVILTDTPKLDFYQHWLQETFEPRALLAVSTALRRADKTEVRGTVLVVDDSPTVREILEDILTANGFRVLLAEDGYEGLVRVRDARPDLIMLDLQMPRMDGYEVCRRLKRDDQTRSIPVVMLTVKELRADQGDGFREGADLYIEKPFTEKGILAIVENVLGLE
jgi:twitching motility two-component system response regulator PilH